jgi:DNA processing protein
MDFDPQFDEPSAAYAPPMAERDRFDWLRLIRSRRVGPQTFHRLMATHGTAAAALAALPGIAAAAGAENYAPCPESAVQAELTAARKAGARMLCRGEADYPAALAEVPDAPPVLWLRGSAEHFARPMVALVGARNASSLGLRMARRLAEGLAAAGFTVVSGLARGIDAEAHRTALPATVAVLAGGVDVIYPPENAPLAELVATQGALLSEHAPGLEPQARHFPLRNRIVSGLSRAVVVVEAAARSGSLITARLALDQGREVMAVPGHPMDARAGGCNQLIRDGALLVRGPQDVADALCASLPAARPAPSRQTPAASPPRGEGTGAGRVRAPDPDAPGPAGLPRRILDRLGPSPLAEDQLIRDLGLPAADVAPELVALEMEGRIERRAGGLLARAD